MKTNVAGRKLIKDFEGCKFKAYLDQGGKPTIGYGHTGPEVHLGQEISQCEADRLLENDLARTELGITKLLKVDVTENEFSALVCLAYNIGLGAIETSTLLHQVNQNNFNAAANEFIKWNKIHSIVNNGLTRRRKAEMCLFLA